MNKSFYRTSRQILFWRSIRKGVAVVNFRPGAEPYLHVYGAACQQEEVLTAIVKTLKPFGSIKSVEYAINGKIITEWDA